MNLPLKKADFFLLFFFLAAAALIAAAPLTGSDDGGLKVKITCRGEVMGIYPLDKDIDVEVSREGHLNIVSIQNNTVHMDFSDCKNQSCVYTGEISTAGETIVCLPNFVIVEIISSEKGGGEDEAIDAIVK